MRFPLLFLFISALTLNSACSQKRDVAVNTPRPPRTVAGKTYFQPQPVTGQPNEFPVRHTEAEWKKLLTPDQFYILREQGTERPFTGKYHDNHAAGTYYCAADHNLLFTSDAKFESGTGWPSFYAPATNTSVKVASDNSFGMSRDEIVCAKCGGHLGHLFDDGPKPTGQRYCMDGNALVFEKKK
ncbi:peptide-methionine (R)-S-oxide reductase MsrB [Hymenobacter negativus]|uniref:peptide-methionine (R)-S-oxide reductase n=1 Tax=Hymenobacter negativus TaxID=2795026 RepID=A0ABS3QER4_9BACT|nr:peptide-methionine (R)-S-oxide reductase MsrB [Hymenobacter negativus]MBO2009667.1 peptide-methionine (R)-S-oxide reductase MsrB [Hymenobacter negativus]